MSCGTIWFQGRLEEAGSCQAQKERAEKEVDARSSRRLLSPTKNKQAQGLDRPEKLSHPKGCPKILGRKSMGKQFLSPFELKSNGEPRGSRTSAASDDGLFLFN